MKLHTLFRGKQGKRARKGIPATQPVPTPLAAVKELTQQELEQVQGGRDISTGLPSGQRMHKPVNE
jgi:bacteriocin-like protein